MFVNEYSPDDDVNADATNSSESVNSSTFTPEGPPLFEQLLPPTAPTTLPDIMNLHGIHMLIQLNFQCGSSSYIKRTMSKETNPVNWKLISAFPLHPL